MSDKGQAMLDVMPPYYAGDDATLAVIDTQGREIERVEELLDTIQQRAFPTLADDVYRLLGMWEALLGLPVEPVGVGVVERRAKVLAHVRKRHSSSGSDWVAVISAALGTTSWTYQEGPSAYTVTITLPYSPGTYNAAQVVALARAITPAHLHLAFTYTVGFILDVSALGDAL